MTEPFTAETFAELVNDEFRVRDDDGEIFVLRLAAAVPVAGPGVGGSAAFSILFRGPAAPVLDEQTYTIEHATVGRFDVRLVPLGSDDVGARYEAVFA
ncbi:MAG TPA: hypothetical protein VHW26_12695 [Solirubrobacteraceae bacterium]|jgi:hypothetical protein|nr:hypothetical protein [Solirubrobacteraceae bacterium]